MEGMSFSGTVVSLMSSRRERRKADGGTIKSFQKPVHWRNLIWLLASALNHNHPREYGWSHNSRRQLPCSPPTNNPRSIRCEQLRRMSIIAISYAHGIQQHEVLSDFGRMMSTESTPHNAITKPKILIRGETIPKESRKHNGNFRLSVWNHNICSTNKVPQPAKTR